MFRYEWKKLLHNRFFIGFLIILLLINAALSYLGAKDGIDENSLTLSIKDRIPAITEAMEAYAEDPEAWKAEFERLRAYRDEKFRTEGFEVEWVAPNGEVYTSIQILPDEQTQKFSDYNLAQIYIDRMEGNIKHIKRIVRAARVELENLAATGVSPTDYDYEYQQQLIEIYSVNALLPLRGGFLLGWDAYFSYTASNVLLVMLLLLLVPGLCLEEHASGMYPILHATKRGRLSTILCKLAVLLCTIVGCVLLFSGSTLAIYGKILGFSDLGTFVQAFDFFKSCPAIVTVGDYLLISIAEKVLVLFTMAIIILLISALIKKYALTFVASLGLVGINLVLHFVVSWDMSSVAGAVKLLGCFTVMDTNTGFTRYHALNLFNHAVSYVPGAMVIYGVMALLCTALTILIFCRTKGKTRTHKASHLSRIKQRIRLPNTAVPLPGRGILAAEVHKNLLANGYLLLILLALIVKVFISGDSWEYRDSFTDSVYREYTVRLEGPMTEEKMDYIIEERVRIDDAKESYEGKLEAHANGWISDEEYREFMDEYTYATQRDEHFRRIEEQADYIVAMQEEGREAHFVYDTGWKVVFAQDFDWLLYGVILLLFAGLFADEYRHKTPFILRAAPRGRLRVFAVKYLVTIVTATMVFAAFIAVDIVGAATTFDLPATDSPIQSMSTFAALPDMSIERYFLLFTAVKYAGVLVLALLSVGVSLLTRKTLSTLSVVAGVTITPYLLRRLGLDIAHFADFTYLLDGNRFIAAAAEHESYRICFTAAVLTVTSAVTVIAACLWVVSGKRRGKDRKTASRRSDRTLIGG